MRKMFRKVLDFIALPFHNTRYTVHGTSAKAPILGKSAVTTDPKIIQLDRFLSCDARHVRNLFFKVHKKLVKKWFQLRWIYKAQSNFEHFFPIPPKSGFQNLTVEREVSRLLMLPGKSNYDLGRTNGRTNERTDERTRHRILTHTRT